MNGARFYAEPNLDDETVVRRSSRYYYDIMHKKSTSIPVSRDLLTRLHRMKEPGETYESVIRQALDLETDDS